METSQFVGIDLHKQTISVCVVDQAQTVLARKRLYCDAPSQIEEFFRSLGTFEAVVEATASYEWLVKLIEPLAKRVVLAHPGKMRVIAENRRKSDRRDAQLLAEELARGGIPEAHRPTPRQREHRRLVRQRAGIVKRLSSCKVRLRRILSDYNKDIASLFSLKGREYLATVPLSPADRFAVDQITAELDFFVKQQADCEERLREFAKEASARETEQRQLLASVPQAGFVTIEVVLAELAGIDRFGSQKQVVSYAGLAPGQRESAGKRKTLGIDKKGSALLRSTLVELAWRMVGKCARWNTVYQDFKARMGAKRAIVAVARRLLCVITAILKTGRPYDAAHRPKNSPKAGPPQPVSGWPSEEETISA